MELYSLSFVLLVAVGLVLYYTVLRRCQWICLLALSLVFFACSGVQGFAFLLFTALTVWGGGLWLAHLDADCAVRRKAPGITKDEKKTVKTQTTRRKKGVVALLLIANFLVLGYFKYWSYFARIFAGALAASAPSALGLVLPLGISFYTFQAVGYLIDCYRGRHPAEKNFAKFLLFIAFFPQLIQGPINRYGAMEPQFTAVHTWEWERTKRALFLLLFGAMKKYAISNLTAPTIAAILDTNDPTLAGSMALTAILLYSLQQYADFSGGIDMVLGVAQLYGIEMMPNFRQPYFSTSLGDFWRRWHISLGAWMRDYLFYPFALTKPMQAFGKWATKHGGKHFGRVLPAAVANLLVFAVVGIWHGPQAHYLVWGLYNGAVIALADLLEPAFKKINTCLHVPTESKGWHVFRILRTFVIVNIGWYFDRMGLTMGAACLRNTFVNFQPAAFTKQAPAMFAVVANPAWGIVVIATALVFVHSVLCEAGRDPYTEVHRLPLPVRWALYYLAIFLVLISFICVNETSGFLYANF